MTLWTILNHGLLHLSWWGTLLVFFGFTHLTIVSVTLYLHRHQTHRALDLHPAVAHVFRFWLWVSTGMVTRQWVSIHRKHHARCETEEDPHSPKVVGIRKVLLEGAELYRVEARNQETMEKFGHGTPDDWVERNVYSRFSARGIVLLLVAYVLMFGWIGVTLWAIHMIWIPLFAAGVINGLGHYWGYRNYECPDWSTNLTPIGILIGGEELHNNHHAYASSARFSSKWWEFDIGWGYIRLLSALRLATVRKVAPVLRYDDRKQVCDIDTARAVVINRFQVMSRFVNDVLHPVHREALRSADTTDREQSELLRRIRHLLGRERTLIDEAGRTSLHRVLARHEALGLAYAMKEKLQDIWARSATSHEQLRHALEEWCHQAEASGIKALRDFSRHLRTCSLSPA